MQDTLTIDDDRPCEVRRYRTRDGLRVVVEIERDRYSEGSYGGSLVAELERECPGLLDGVTEPYELPAIEQHIPRFMPRLLSLKPDIALMLLQGKQRRRIPKIELVRILQRSELRRDRHALYVRREKNSLLTFTVSVISACGNTVTCHTYSGHRSVDDDRVKGMISDSLAEARESIGGHS